MVFDAVLFLVRRFSTMAQNLFSGPMSFASHFIFFSLSPLVFWELVLLPKRWPACSRTVAVRDINWPICMFQWPSEENGIFNHFYFSAENASLLCTASKHTKCVTLRAFYFLLCYDCLGSRWRRYLSNLWSLILTSVIDFSSSIAFDPYRRNTQLIWYKASSVRPNHRLSRGFVSVLVETFSCIMLRNSSTKKWIWFEPHRSFNLTLMQSKIVLQSLSNNSFVIKIDGFITFTIASSKTLQS